MGKGYMKESYLVSQERVWSESHPECESTVIV